MLKLLDPFFKELHDMFCDGFNVEYNYPPNLISEHLRPGDGEQTIQAMLWLVTGDHPVQCKMGMLKLSGVSACHRCKMHAELKDGRYVYGRNREQFCVPPPPRNSTELWTAVNEWIKIPWSQHAALKIHCHGTGITGESPLWQLYHLYKFDISKDLVYDVMHMAGLNIFKTYIKKLFAWIGDDDVKIKR